MAGHETGQVASAGLVVAGCTGLVARRAVHIVTAVETVLIAAHCEAALAPPLPANYPGSSVVVTARLVLVANAAVVDRPALSD